LPAAHYGDVLSGIGRGDPARPRRMVRLSLPFPTLVASYIYVRRETAKPGTFWNFIAGEEPERPR